PHRSRKDETHPPGPSEATAPLASLLATPARSIGTLIVFRPPFAGRMRSQSPSILASVRRSGGSLYRPKRRYVPAQILLLEHPLAATSSRTPRRRDSFPGAIE